MCVMRICGLTEGDINRHGVNWLVCYFYIVAKGNQD